MLVAVVVLAALTGDQQTLLVCTLVSAVVGPLLVAVVTTVVTSRAGHNVETKVDAVHHEVRPPSNGTTTGAIAETNQAWWVWVYEELRMIGGHLGLDPHAPPPELVQADPPVRPDDRRRPRHPQEPEGV